MRKLKDALTALRDSQVFVDDRMTVDPDALFEVLALAGDIPEASTRISQLEDENRLFRLALEDAEKVVAGLVAYIRQALGSKP